MRNVVQVTVSTYQWLTQFQFVFPHQEAQKRSWDYNQCQMGLLSVLVAGAIGLPVTLSLPHNPNRRFAVGGLVVILEVVFLMIWVKALKVIPTNNRVLKVIKYQQYFGIC